MTAIVLIVYTRRGVGRTDACELTTGSDRDPANRLAILQCKVPRNTRAPRQTRYDFASTLAERTRTR